MKSVRQVVRNQDIQNYFGKKRGMAQKMMTEMKKHFGKEKYQPITIQDFCEYYNVEKESFIESLQAADESLKPTKL